MPEDNTTHNRNEEKVVRKGVFHLQHNYNYPVYYELYSMQVFSYILIT
jgi:hypothetical protein